MVVKLNWLAVIVAPKTTGITPTHAPPGGARPNPWANMYYDPFSTTTGKLKIEQSAKLKWEALPWGPMEDFGRMIFQKKSPLGSISWSSNVPWCRRSAAPEQLLQDLA